MAGRHPETACAPRRAENQKQAQKQEWLSAPTRKGREFDSGKEKVVCGARQQTQTEPKPSDRPGGKKNSVHQFSVFCSQVNVDQDARRKEEGELARSGAEWASGFGVRVHVHLPRFALNKINRQRKRKRIRSDCRVDLKRGTGAAPSLAPVVKGERAGRQFGLRECDGRRAPVGEKGRCHGAPVGEKWRCVKECWQAGGFNWKQAVRGEEGLRRRLSWERAVATWKPQMNVGFSTFMLIPTHQFQHIFWMSPKHVSLAQRFSDVVINDIAMLCNMYGMPLNMFVVINHFLIRYIPVKRQMIMNGLSVACSVFFDSTWTASFSPIEMLDSVLL
ncbi:hypothetical protein B0H13DRAFT_1889768 [Mycena leptocephala]|nr:hypothetical protein B0H13DRAFT_1889768 [Mycena leptocephala]